MGRARTTGFTLIELMIVVAIIALLSAIAIPNFLKFQCRGKQAEVKAGLGALFVSEKSFFGEYTTFGTDLLSLGWEPSGAPLYLYGFGTAFPATVDGVPGYDGARNHTLHSAVVGTPPKYDTDKTLRLTGSALTPSELPPTACNGQSFIIGGVGDINPDQGLQLDTWVMQQSRQMLPVTNDCLIQ